MKQVMLTVEQAKAFFVDLEKALNPAALSEQFVWGDLSDRDTRALAEILREQVLLAEEKRIAAARKPRPVAAPPKV